MKSYEEMTKSVLERGDRYFRRKEKRIAAIKKGVPVMSIFGIFTLVGLSLLNIGSNEEAEPNIPQQIEIVETQTETQIQTETSATDNTDYTSTNIAAPKVTSSVSTTLPAMTSSPVTTTSAPVSRTKATSRNIIARETLASSTVSVSAATSQTNAGTETTVTTVISDVTTAQTEIISRSDLEFDYMIKSDGTIEIIEPVNEPDKYEHFEKLTIPSEIDGRKVTSIGANAFLGLDNLTEVYLPDTVTGIGEYAFFSCGSLSEISFPENVKYEYIGASAFHNTPWLKAKRKEADLVTVNNVLYDGFNAQGYLWTHQGITYICDTAFMENTSLKAIEFDEDIEYVGYCAFAYCTELQSVSFNGSVKVIEESAFANCYSLKLVTITGGLEAIGETAFYNCTSLEDIILPDTVESIGSGAFSETPALESIRIKNPDCDIYDYSETIYDGTVIYGYAGSTAEEYAKKYDRTFVAIDASKQTSGTWGSNVFWTLNDTTLTISGNGSIAGITNFVNVYHNKFGNAPDNFKADYPWSEYYNVITDVIIENGITSIPSGAFCYYPELKNAEFPDSLLSIEGNAFTCCKNLRKITIPENTVIINDDAASEPFGYSISSYTNENADMAAFYAVEKENSVNYRLTINGYDYSSSYYYCISEDICSFNSLGTAKNPFIAPYGSAGSDITWSFSDLGTMTFSGNGFIEHTNLNEDALKIAPYVRKVVFDNGITGIGDNAFVLFDYIEEIELADTITEIGDAAFASSINTMGSVTIPKSVKKIGSGAICTKNGIIYGYSNTAAEEYALENNIDFVSLGVAIPGDVNGDGNISLSDAYITIRYYAMTCAGLDPQFKDIMPSEIVNEEEAFYSADFDHNNIINLNDVQLILNEYCREITDSINSY